VSLWPLRHVNVDWMPAAFRDEIKRPTLKLPCWRLHYELYGVRALPLAIFALILHIDRVRSGSA
jgi:hypothetical protein